MQPIRNIIYLHGFASSGQGAKAQFLRPRLAAYPNVAFHAFEFSPTPKDFEYLTVTGMINRLRQYVLDRALANVGFIGSSMGGLVGLNYAHRYGGVDAMLLLAPALTYLSRDDSDWRAAGVVEVDHYAFARPLPLRYELEIDGRFFTTPPPPPAPITIMHGRADDIVPIQGSRDYAARYPEQVRLFAIEAGHDVNAHLERIWQEVDAVLLS